MNREHQLESLLREIMEDPARAMTHAYRTYQLKPGEERGEFTADITHELPHRKGCLRCKAEALLGERILEPLEVYVEHMTGKLPASPLGENK